MMTEEELSQFCALKAENTLLIRHNMDLMERHEENINKIESQSNEVVKLKKTIQELEHKLKIQLTFTPGELNMFRRDKFVKQLEDNTARFKHNYDRTLKEYKALRDEFIKFKTKHNLW